MDERERTEENVVREPLMKPAREGALRRAAPVASPEREYTPNEPEDERPQRPASRLVEREPQPAVQRPTLGGQYGAWSAPPWAGYAYAPQQPVYYPPAWPQPMSPMACCACCPRGVRCPYQDNKKEPNAAPKEEQDAVPTSQMAQPMPVDLHTLDFAPKQASRWPLVALCAALAVALAAVTLFKTDWGEPVREAFSFLKPEPTQNVTFPTPGVTPIPTLGTASAPVVFVTVSPAR